MKSLLPDTKSYEKIEKKARDEACRFFMIVIASVLTDKFNYNREQTIDLLKKMNEKADSINKGYVTLNDLENTLIDEYLIKFD